MTTTILLFITGLAILIFGADLFVRGALRLEGGLLLTYYVLYLIHIVMDAAGDSMLGILRRGSAFFIPLTFMVLVMTALRSMRANLKPKAD